MLGLHKRDKRSVGVLLVSFLLIALFLSGCFSIFEFIFIKIKKGIRTGSSGVLIVQADLHMIGTPDSTNWVGTRHAYEGFQFPTQWSPGVQCNLVTSYEIYKVKTKADSLMRTGRLTWHYSPKVTRMLEAKESAKEGNDWRGFESDQAIPYDSISGYVGSGSHYYISYACTLAIPLADSLGNTLCGEIPGDEIDEFEELPGSSFLVDADPSHLPTMTQWGIIVLAALIVASAAYVMLKRRKATVPV